MWRTRRAAFTLIELLVVIAVVAVLLALLSPALDRAISQAQLAICATQLRGIGGGSSVYAGSNRRFYPYRFWRTAGNGRPNLLCDTFLGNDRPNFRDAFPLQLLIDPFVDRISLNEIDAPTNNTIYVNRSVFAGWQYKSYHGLLKLGDTWTYPDIDDPEYLNRFDVLATDVDTIRGDRVEIHSAHPDIEPRLKLYTWRNQDLALATQASAAPHTFSEWGQGVGAGRGAVDAYQYGHVDGSVSRLTNVQVSHRVSGINRPGDGRLKGVPPYYGGNKDNTATNSHFWMIPGAHRQ